MGKRFFCALLALFAATAVHAFPQPPDVPTPVGLDPQYETTTAIDVPLDAFTTPMSVTPLTNIPVPSTTNRIVTNGPFDGTVSPYCLSIPFGGTCQQNKFRTLADFVTMAPDDPVRNYGQPATSHLHCFFGGGNPSAFATYATDRAHALSSRAVGTDANGTLYWYPCVISANPYGDGKSYAIRPDVITVYYVQNPASDGTGAGATAPIPTGLRYVFGFDMDAASPSVGAGGQYAWLLPDLTRDNAAYFAANGGNANRYQLTNPGDGTFATQAAYACLSATPTQVNVLKNSDGSDPFGGTCNGAQITASTSGTTLTVTAVQKGTVYVGEALADTTGHLTAAHITALGTGTGGVGTYTIDNAQTVASETMTALQDFYIIISGADCYNGKDLWSPGGYKHLIPQVWDAVKSVQVCPKNYYKLPRLTLEIHFTQYGWTDRSTWDLSSDIAYRAAHALTTAQLPPGTTFHTDWLDGWDDNIRKLWEGGFGNDGCVAVLHSVGHECNTSQMTSTQRLKGIVGEAGVSRNPQIDSSSEPRVNATDHGWMLIPPAWISALSNMNMRH